MLCTLVAVHAITTFSGPRLHPLILVRPVVRPRDSGRSARLGPPSVRCAHYRLACRACPRSLRHACRQPWLVPCPPLRLLRRGGRGKNGWGGWSDAYWQMNNTNIFFIRPAQQMRADGKNGSTADQRRVGSERGNPDESGPGPSKRVFECLVPARRDSAVSDQSDAASHP